MNRTQHREPLRVALIGASGRMGREIEGLAAGQGVEILLRYDAQNPPPGRLTDVSIDVAIDFTLPDVVLGNIERVLDWGVPMVVGTTGWLDALPDVKQLIEATGGRLIWASNFSVGVQTFFRIVHRAAELINEIPGYDVALHEEHHIRKADSPSGTARSLAEILLSQIDRKRQTLVETLHDRIDPAALHVTSRRVGATPGTHIITIDSEADTIELAHRARNRSGFALGALVAARWIVQAEPGLYCFDEVFEDILKRNEQKELS
ncbi:MAG: 4-hydroxy-tetrahydrodipicolinate reductase [Chlorobi bacterium]|nr:4-hydroxy-tetrahydrodipicolinate reductase [Chlorobiota bacterium]